MRREMKKKHTPFSGMMRIINHFFPHFSNMLNQMKDPRHLSYVIYSQATLIMLVLMKCNSAIVSMRGMTKQFNTDEAIANLSYMSGQKLEEKPDWQTINNYLERLIPDQLQAILQKMIKILIRTKVFAQYAIKRKYVVIIDGTDYAFFRKKHSPHDLVRKITDKETGETSYQYFNKALEAKILLAPGLLCSISTEFIENEAEDVTKQDCELKAGYRLLEKLKKAFPKMEFLIVADALYAVMPFMKAVRENGWNYLFRVKDGRQEKLMEDFEDLLDHIDKDDIVRNFIDGENGTGKFVNHVEQVTDKPEICNMIRYVYTDDEGEPKTFTWITDITITKKNVRQLIKAARSRWMIENEGFNIEKCGIYELEHHCSEDYNAMKNHYLLIQISHLLMQLYMAYDHIVYELDEGIKHVAADFGVSFKTHTLNETDKVYIETKTALHLCSALVG